MSRLSTNAGAESGYPPDELAAFELLRWAIRKATPPADGPEGHRHDAAAGIVSSLPPALYRASMSAAGWSALTVSLMKMQARGQVLPRRAHEWVDLVVGWDFYDREQDFHPVIGIHLPLAARAGIRPEEIDALRRARVAELEQDDRDLVRLIREIVAGTVSHRSYESRFAKAAFHWTQSVDIEPYIVRLDALIFEELEASMIASTHGLPIGDPAATMPVVREGSGSWAPH